jgi:threonine aldolase
VWFTIDPERGTAAEFASRLKERGVLVSALGPQNLRACTHLDVGRERAEFAAEMIAAVAGG